MNTCEDQLIAEQFTRYETKELWKTLAGYEIRLRANKEKSPYESIEPIDAEEAAVFEREAERQAQHWADVHKEHTDVAQIVDTATGCEWVYNLEKLADGTYRIVDCPIGPEEVDDYEIRPANEATVAQFLQEAEEQRIIKEELKFNHDCPRCPSCGQAGQWDFRFGLRIVIHEDAVGAPRWCINPNHRSAEICPVCHEVGLRYDRENGDVEYLHGGAGTFLNDQVWHRSPGQPCGEGSVDTKPPFERSFQEELDEFLQQDPPPEGYVELEDEELAALEEFLQTEYHLCEIAGRISTPILLQPVPEYSPKHRGVYPRNYFYRIAYDGTIGAAVKEAIRAQMKGSHGH